MMPGTRDTFVRAWIDTATKKRAISVLRDMVYGATPTVCIPISIVPVYIFVKKSNPVV